MCEFELSTMQSCKFTAKCFVRNRGRFTESRVNNYTGFGRTPLCYSTNDCVHNYMFWEEAGNSRATMTRNLVELSFK